MHSRRAAAGLMDIPGVYEVLHMNYYDSMQELIGCVIVFAAVIIAQIV